MTKREIRKYNTLFRRMERRLKTRGLTINMRPSDPEERDFIRKVYEKYNQKLIKARLRRSWNS